MRTTQRWPHLVSAAVSSLVFLVGAESGSDASRPPVDVEVEDPRPLGSCGVGVHLARGCRVGSAGFGRSTRRRQDTQAEIIEDSPNWVSHTRIGGPSPVQANDAREPLDSIIQFFDVEGT